MDDLSFLEELMCETKELANGNKFFVFSFVIDETFACNLCGVSKMHQSDLLRHRDSPTHKELLKIEKVPYKKWMKDCIIEVTGFNIDPTVDLKFLIWSEFCKDDNFKQLSKQASEKLKSRKYRINHSLSSQSITSSEPNSFVGSLHDHFDVQSATFHTMCRQLTILEDYLDENLKSAVKNLFIKSLALESESTGASEQLLTTDNMKLLQDVNDHLFAQLEKIPPKILHIYRRILLQLAAFYETAQK